MGYGKAPGSKRPEAGVAAHFAEPQSGEEVQLPEYLHPATAELSYWNMAEIGVCSSPTKGSEPPVAPKVPFSYPAVNPKKLRIALSSVESFEDPKIELEQYMTQPEVCAHVLSHAARLGDIAGKNVGDLGCGTGMLSIAADLSGASRVVGFDIDAEALAIAESNCEKLGCEAIEFINCDVRRLPLRPARSATATVPPELAKPASTVASGPASEGSGSTSASLPSSGTASSTPAPAGVFDTVLTNPPFGTRDAGADMRFLAAGLGLVREGGAVYSMHKSSTREHVLKVAKEGLGASEAKVVAELRFDLPKSYAFHTKSSADVAVDLVRVVR